MARFKGGVAGACSWGDGAYGKDGGLSSCGLDWMPGWGSAP